MPDDTPDLERTFDLVQQGLLSLDYILELFGLDPESLNESLIRSPVPEYELVTTRF